MATHSSVLAWRISGAGKPGGLPSMGSHRVGHDWSDLAAATVKVPFSQNYGFSSSQVWMWELDYKESWVPKNWCFWTVMLEKTLRVPWTARRSSQSILKEISPEYSLEGLMLKLKLQYFGHLIGRTYSLGKPWGWERLKAGGEGDHRGWDGWMVSPTRWTWVWASSRSWWWTGKPGMLLSMGSQRVGHNWAELNRLILMTPPLLLFSC